MTELSSSQSGVPELLVPAGDMERLRTALLYGADAVYLGGTEGNLRAASSGFDPDALSLAVGLADRSRARVYYCLNAYPLERDMRSMPALIEDAAGSGVHAFIAADPGVLRLARKLAPAVPVHISTQANTTNAEAVRFWLDNGASRVNLARELSCRDIRAIRRSLPDAELEVFVHGAMCLAVSGQCLMSAWLNNRPANQGRCSQPCRFEYRAVDAAVPPALTLEEAFRPDLRLWDVVQDEEYAAIFAPDDLCLLPFLPWFVRNRLDSLKVEGRTKSSSYVAHVTDALSTALRAAAGARAGRSSFDPAVYFPDLARSATRPLSTGFFLPTRRTLGGPGWQADPRPLLGRVVGPSDNRADGWEVEVRGRWEADRPLEFMLPGMRRPVLQPGAYSLENHRGERASLVHPGTRAVLFARTDALRPEIFLRGL